MVTVWREKHILDSVPPRKIAFDLDNTPQSPKQIPPTAIAVSRRFLGH